MPFISHEEAQELHLIIGTFIETEPYAAKASGLDRALEIAAIIVSDTDPDGEEDDEDECEGHESLRGDSMGETVFCDGSCI